MTNILINDDMKLSNYKNNKNELKLLELVIKLEKNFKNLQQNINIDIMDNQIARLPNLNLNFTNHNEYDNYEEDNDKKRNRRHKSTKSYKNSRSNSFIRSRTKSDPRSKFIQTFNDSDLQQSTITSSMSTNADLSEDEQINYYDDSLNNQQNNDNNITLTSLNSSSSVKSPIKVEPTTSNRRSSNSSDRTLVVMPTESIITENINLITDHSLPSYSKVNGDKDFNQYNANSPYQNNESEESDKENSEYISDENQSDEDSNSDDEVYDMKDKQDDKEINILEPNDELISIKIKTKTCGDEESLNNFERPPSLPKNDPPDLMLDLINNQVNNNDLSDDEVKEYNVFKENLF